ncbi:MAG: hypothetical protein QW733_01905 [Desulfurococcaceae archaeon]
MRKIKDVVEFLVGLVVGVGFGYVFVEGLFSEDEVQKQVARKAYCKTVEEMLMNSKSPEEMLKVLAKHEKILAKCEEVSHEH